MASISLKKGTTIKYSKKWIRNFKIHIHQKPLKKINEISIKYGKSNWRRSK